MTHVITITCECGAQVAVPTALREDQTLLGNTALADTMIGLMTPTLEARCTCPDEPVGET